MYIVADLMTKFPVSVSPQASREECITHLLNKNTPAILVVSQGILKGIITKTDILKKNANHALELSSRKIAIINPEASIYDALDKMEKLNFTQLPVLHNNKPIGIITLQSVYEGLIKVSSTKTVESSPNYEGVCDSCNALTIVRPINNKMICYNCKN